MFLQLWSNHMTSEDLLLKSFDSGSLYLLKFRMQVRARCSEASLRPHLFLIFNCKHFLLGPSGRRGHIIYNTDCANQPICSEHHYFVLWEATLDKVERRVGRSCSVVHPPLLSPNTWFTFHSRNITEIKTDCFW